MIKFTLTYNDILRFTLLFLPFRPPSLLSALRILHTNGHHCQEKSNTDDRAAAACKSRSDAMWSDIDAERTAYQSAIRRLSEKYEM